MGLFEEEVAKVFEVVEAGSDAGPVPARGGAFVVVEVHHLVEDRSTLLAGAAARYFDASLPLTARFSAIVNLIVPATSPAYTVDRPPPLGKIFR